jgi:hypothetical protein
VPEFTGVTVVISIRNKIPEDVMQWVEWAMSKGFEVSIYPEMIEEDASPKAQMVTYIQTNQPSTMEQGKSPQCGFGTDKVSEEIPTTGDLKLPWCRRCNPNTPGVFGICGAHAEDHDAAQTDEDIKTRLLLNQTLKTEADMRRMTSEQ